MRPVGVELPGLVDGVPRSDDLDRYRSRASFAGDWVGEWNLGPADAFEVARFSGRTARLRICTSTTPTGSASSTVGAGSASTGSTTAGSTTTATDGTGKGGMVMNKVNKIKHKTAIPLDESRPTKPVAPSTVGRAHRVEPYILVSPERGPRKTDTMPEAIGDSSGDRVKPPVAQDAKRPPRSKRAVVEMGDQRPKGENEHSTTGRKEQYIRMRIRVSEGYLSVIDSHLVDGRSPRRVVSPVGTHTK